MHDVSTSRLMRCCGKFMLFVLSVSMQWLGFFLCGWSLCCMLSSESSSDVES